jgi:hypothetical protein
MKRAQNAVWSGVWGVALAVAVVLLLLGTRRASSAASTEKGWVTEYVNMLSAEDGRKVNQAVDGILHDRKLLVDELIGLIDPANATEYRDETRCAAAFLLGELRAVEAVPVLSRALADEPGPEFNDRMSRFTAPVWTALVKIGRPSVPAMIENVENSDQEILWHKSLDVLNHVLSGKRRVLELLAKLEARAAKDDAKHGRIVRAAKWAEEHYKGSGEPLY